MIHCFFKQNVAGEEDPDDEMIVDEATRIFTGREASRLLENEAVKTVIEQEFWYEIDLIANVLRVIKEGSIPKKQ